MSRHLYELDNMIDELKKYYNYHSKLPAAAQLKKKKLKRRINGE